ncbi:hypothetical protein ABWH96_18185 [Marivirga tractuosa]|uniref:hypothetical protein n=1 Tax=Marivirga tractuosa TaxID=1006 RepID=UPI0035D08719
MIRILYLVAFSFLIISCGDQKEGKESSFKSIKIDLDEAQTLKISDHFKLKDVIYFSDSLVVDNLMKVDVHNDYLVMHCGWGLDYLLIKNMVSGEEIAISAKGEGPNQYQKLSNFFINPDGQIELLDGQAGKILTYNFEGELLSVYQNKQLQGASSLISLNGEDYFLYGGNFYAPKYGYQLLVWDKNRDEILNTYFPFNENKADFMNFIESRNFMQKPASFFQFYNPFVYQLNENSIIDSTYLNFGKHTIPEELLNKSYQDVREFSQSMAKSGYAYGVGDILLNEQFMFTSALKNEKRFHIYTSTKTKETKVYDKIDNDVFGLRVDEKIGYYHRPIVLDEKHIYFIVNLEAQHEKIESADLQKSSQSKLNQELLKLIQDYEDGDNLAIVKCELDGFKN